MSFQSKTRNSEAPIMLVCPDPALIWRRTKSRSGLHSSSCLVSSPTCPPQPSGKSANVAQMIPTKSPFSSAPSQPTSLALSSVSSPPNCFEAGTEAPFSKSSLPSAPLAHGFHLLRSKRQGQKCAFRGAVYVGRRRGGHRRVLLCRWSSYLERMQVRPQTPFAAAYVYPLLAT